MEHSRTQQLLTSLRESIVDKPPYISGTLKLPESCFSVFYKLSKGDDAARHINLANATPEKLEQLAQACEPASFGLKQELDVTYREAGEMDSECFSSTLDLSHTDLPNIIRGYLLEGIQSTNNLKTERYKLNIYSKGSFLKPHVDTPRSGKMFGSLVIVLPSPHEGGALLLRHRGQEWTFDSGKLLEAAEDQPSIGYVAFFSDIEHEVVPVTSGYRVTLTYNLYFDDGGPNDAVSGHLVHPRPPNQDRFRNAFAALLENPEFLADGGTLAFGLRHVYPIKDSLNNVYKILKGSDAVVYQSALTLGYEPVLYVYYVYCDNRGVMIDKMVDFTRWMEEFCSNEAPNFEDVVHMEGGVFVHPEGKPNPEVDISDRIEWVTPVTKFNRKADAIAGTYGDVCLVVRVGKAGDRLGYPTVTQLKRAYAHSDRRVELRNRNYY